MSSAFGTLAWAAVPTTHLVLETAPPPQVYYSMTNTVPCNNGSPRHTASRNNTSPLIISKSTTKYPCALDTSLFRNHNADYSLPFYNAKHVCGEYKKCSQNALGYIDSPFSLLWNSSTRQHTCDCVGLIRLGGDLGRFELMNVCKCYQTVPREASGGVSVTAALVINVVNNRMTITRHGRIVTCISSVPRRVSRQTREGVNSVENC